MINVFRWVIKILTYILFSIIAVTNIFSQQKSNLEIFDSEIQSGLERIFFLPDLKRDVQFIFSVNSVKNNETEVRFLNSVIKKAAERNKLRVSLTKGNISSTDSVFNTVYIDIVRLNTQYPGFAANKFLGDKLVNRNINALINVTVHGHGYDFSAIDTVAVNYKDRVDYDEIENIEAGEYKFTQAKAPKISIYEEIVFPIAIVAVSVVAAVLFFSIRSK